MTATSQERKLGDGESTPLRSRQSVRPSDPGYDAYVEVTLSPRAEFSKAINGLHAACYDATRTCKFCGVRHPTSSTHTPECPVGAYELACIRSAAHPGTGSIADLRLALERYETTLADPAGPLISGSREAYESLMEAAHRVVGDSSFIAGHEYGSPNVRNGKPNTRGPLFWFSLVSYADEKDGVVGWLHEQTFNELAARLGLPRLEKQP
jgi:hypothetical protein